MSDTNRNRSRQRDAAEREPSGPQPPADDPDDQPGRVDRGQTTIDFTIGVTIFLTAMVFTFAFAPGILSPFTESGQQDTVTVDRVANHLGQDLLGSPQEPYVLDRHCTVAFFEGSSPPTCRWESGSLNEKLGLGEFERVNVTITGNVSGGQDANLVHWDEDAHEFTEDDSDGDVALAVGNRPPQENQATVTAERVASLNREDVRITVVVW